MTLLVHERPATAGDGLAHLQIGSESFAAWRSAVLQRRTLPVIAVAGTRGKSTVVRLLESIFSAAGLSCAIWTDRGVEIEGQSQPSELGAWGEALRRLAGGSLDVAIQELDWPTIHAVGLPEGVYPLSIITNICLNSDRCLARPESQLAVRAYDRLRQATRRDGLLVLNADDFSVAGTEVERESEAILAGQNPDAPTLRAHLSEGGRAAWVEEYEVVFGTTTASFRASTIDQIDFALAGAAAFEVQNALMAVAAAAATGIEGEEIRRALERFQIPPSAPGSFNLVALGEAMAVLDRPAPSWILRQVLRAVRHRPHRSLIATIGRLDGVSDDDLEEVGRLVARVSDVVILHSDAQESPRRRAFQAGMGGAEGPIVVIRRATESLAIETATARLKPGDLLLVLADEPTMALAAIQAGHEQTSRPPTVSTPSSEGR